MIVELEKYLNMTGAEIDSLSANHLIDMIVAQAQYLGALKFSMEGFTEPFDCGKAKLDDGTDNPEQEIVNVIVDRERFNEELLNELVGKLKKKTLPEWLQDEDED